MHKWFKDKKELEEWLGKEYNIKMFTDILRGINI